VGTRGHIVAVVYSFKNCCSDPLEVESAHTQDLVIYTTQSKDVLNSEDFPNLPSIDHDIVHAIEVCPS